MKFVQSLSGFVVKATEALSRGIGGSRIPWSVLVLALAGVWAIVVFVRCIMFFFG